MKKKKILIFHHINRCSSKAGRCPLKETDEPPNNLLYLDRTSDRHTRLFGLGLGTRPTWLG